jgi:hypothetical protein
LKLEWEAGWRKDSPIPLPVSSFHWPHCGKNDDCHRLRVSGSEGPLLTTRRYVSALGQFIIPDLSASPSGSSFMANNGRSLFSGLLTISQINLRSPPSIYENYPSLSPLSPLSLSFLSPLFSLSPLSLLSLFSLSSLSLSPLSRALPSLTHFDPSPLSPMTQTMQISPSSIPLPPSQNATRKTNQITQIPQEDHYSTTFFSKILL